LSGSGSIASAFELVCVPLRSVLAGSEAGESAKEGDPGEKEGSGDVYGTPGCGVVARRGGTRHGSCGKAETLSRRGNSHGYY
jgi:hypothetical protein